MKIATVLKASSRGARQMVAFIHGRHCSRFPLTASLDHAIDTARSYGTEEDTIARDWKAVDAYHDLDQYTRGHQPYRKV